MQMGEFKQEILRINNKVNMIVFGQGLLAQRVEVFGNKVLIVAKNRRVKVLAQVEKMDKDTTDLMDRALVVKHKQEFIDAMKEEMGVNVLSHLKDYDPKLEISISVSIFEEPIEDLIPKLRLQQPDPAE